MGSHYYSETPVKSARKVHRCRGCPKDIEIGQPYLRCSGAWDGNFWAAKYHTECRRAEDDYNNKNRNYFTEWYTIDEIDEEDWPWLLEKHQVVAARYGINQIKIDINVVARQARLAELMAKLSSEEPNP